jgi:hypothetical protein
VGRVANTREELRAIEARLPALFPLTRRDQISSQIALDTCGGTFIAFEIHDCTFVWSGARRQQSTIVQFIWAKMLGASMGSAHFSLNPSYHVPIWVNSHNVLTELGITVSSGSNMENAREVSRRIRKCIHDISHSVLISRHVQQQQHNRTRSLLAALRPGLRHLKNTKNMN